ncbi:hypothetical protein ACTZWW_04165 [Salinarimonas sp. NSM]|uniref:hypothetical protein n=1 Tax=Salinarimonas sp. NSM TaxID=3458003 RepID=UPI0040366E25
MSMPFAVVAVYMGFAGLGLLLGLPSSRWRYIMLFVVMIAAGLWLAPPGWFFGEPQASAG